MTDKDKELKENIKFLAKCCNKEYNDIRVDAVLLGSLDLINSQQAEIERLKIENQSLRGAANSYKLHYNEEKAEVVKEFVERLKECKHECGCNYRKKPVYAVTEEIIDNLVKEMIGDTK